jgi:hypothetical protein
MLVEKNLCGSQRPYTSIEKCNQMKIQKEIRLFLTGLLFSTSLFVFNGCNESRPSAVRAGSRVFYSDSVVYLGAATIANCLFDYGHDMTCKEMIFSCGNFGQSEIALAGADLELWNSMIVLTDDGLYAPREFNNGLFEITYEKTSGTICEGEQQKHNAVIPKLTAFRLIALADTITGQVDTTQIQSVIHN